MHLTHPIYTLINCWLSSANVLCYSLGLPCSLDLKCTNQMTCCSMEIMCSGVSMSSKCCCQAPVERKT